MLRDERVLPEVRNRPLLPRVFFSYSTFEILSESSRGTFRLIHSISDISMRSSCSLKSFRGWGLACFEPHLDTDFEIYGSSIGVCNIPYFIPLCLNRKFRICISNQIKQIKSFAIPTIQNNPFSQPPYQA